MLTGIIGYPIKKTLSPVMHNAAYKYLGIDGQYARLAIKRNALKSIIEHLITTGYQGVNITVPYKQAVIRYLDSMTETATRVKAVNTIIIKNKRVIGENTDVFGFRQSLRHHRVSVRGKRILVIGAGGGGYAVGSVLAELESASLLIADIARRRAKNLADYIGAEMICPERVRSLKGRCDIVINASPVDHQSLALTILNSGGLYYDLNYIFTGPGIDRVRVINGLEMLVQQGARSFELWTGKRAPVRIMRKAVQRHV